MSYIDFVFVIMLAIALIASITDLRTGLIPNWLTFPALALSLLLGAANAGFRGVAGALLGMLIAGVLPAIFQRLGGMGGGDVKLFAALGGLGGPRLGLEIELLAVTCACVWGLAKLTYQGQLLRALGNSGRLFVNLFLPTEHHRPIDPEQLTPLRIGSAIFAGTAFAVIDHRWLG